MKNILDITGHDILLKTLILCSNSHQIVNDCIIILMFTVIYHVQNFTCNQNRFFTFFIKINTQKSYKIIMIIYLPLNNEIMFQNNILRSKNKT